MILIDIATNDETLLWRLPITSEYAESGWQIGQVTVEVR